MKAERARTKAVVGRKYKNRVRITQMPKGLKEKEDRETEVNNSVGIAQVPKGLEAGEVENKRTTLE